jgi:histidine triad (HIT) family protein
MYNHQPDNYDCPFCRIISQAKDTIEGTEVIHQTELVTAFLSLSRWEKNPMDVLVVPRLHTENLYDLPLELVPALHQATRAVALALKAINRCDGISTRQHNEPAGDQDVWHYHVHITPRFTGDRFYEYRRVPFPEAERLSAARQLREYLNENRSLLF